MISAGENGRDILNRVVPQAIANLCNQIPRALTWKGMMVDCPAEVEEHIRNTCVADQDPERLKSCLQEFKSTILGHKARVAQTNRAEKGQQTGLTLDLADPSYAASKGRAGIHEELRRVKEKYPAVPPVPPFPGVAAVRAMVAVDSTALKGFDEVANACKDIKWDYAKGLCERGVEDILKQIWVALEGKQDRLVLFFKNETAALKVSLGDKDPGIEVTIGRGYPVKVQVSNAFRFIKEELAKMAEDQAKKEETPPAPPAPPAPKQCADGIDNDGDKKVDFVPPAGKEKDPDCSSADDNVEKEEEIPTTNAFHPLSGIFATIGGPFNDGPRSAVAQRREGDGDGDGSCNPARCKPGDRPSADDNGNGGGSSDDPTGGDRVRFVPKLQVGIRGLRYDISQESPVHPFIEGMFIFNWFDAQWEDPANVDKAEPESFYMLQLGATPGLQFWDFMRLRANIGGSYGWGYGNFPQGSLAKEVDSDDLDVWGFHFQTDFNIGVPIKAEFWGAKFIVPGVVLVGAYDTFSMKNIEGDNDVKLETPVLGSKWSLYLGGELGLAF